MRRNVAPGSWRKPLPKFPILNQMRHRMNVPTRSILLFSAFFLGLPACHAVSETGTSAPPLHIAKLLQAPPGTRLDWTSFKGKTVVLEFWATWCGPCVASIPHLNQLAASLDPHKFVFISIDDEDPAVVEGFLHKRKMAGWVGLDSNAATFKAFGVDARPATIVVDGFGKIASVTTSDKLTEENLIALANKRPSSPAPKVISKPSNSTTTSQGITTPAAQRDLDPLFELSIRPSTRRQNDFGMMHSTNGKRWGYMGVDSMFLLSHAYSIPSDRIEFEEGQPNDRYDFAADRGDLDPDAFYRMMQTALPSALGQRVTEERMTQTVLVLRLKGNSVKTLQEADSTEASYITFKDGKLLISNSSLKQIADVLEGHLKEVVIDKTGLDGRYDAELDLPSEDAKGITTAFGTAFDIGFSPELAEVSVLKVHQSRH
jgi:uncharacterized protein (TIGR03435 family)